MIQLDHIKRIFHVGDQTVAALDGIDLNIDKGEYLAIMGPSGSGKSTLLNMIGLLDSPTSGSYQLDGQDVTALSDIEQAQVRQSKIGFVFQFFHLIPRLTAAQNVELPMTLAGIPAEQRQQRVIQSLAAYGLADRMHHRPDQLSGGQRQRVAIARASIMQPAVLLADEPTGNLDQASGKEVLNILEDLNRKGLTLLMVTHDQMIADRAQRIIRIVDGKITSDERR